MNSIILFANPLPVVRLINLNQYKFFKSIKHVLKNNFVYKLMAAPVI